MLGAAVSGRSATPRPPKEVRLIAPETSGHRGVPEHAVTRANRSDAVVCRGSWCHSLPRRERADEDQPRLTVRTDQRLD
jgi:hypothetical protein